MSAKSTAKITIWLWPTGLFPRRVIYYLRAKNITLSVLRDHNIELIPVSLDAKTVRFVTKAEHEAPPPGVSNPCMRIQSAEVGSSATDKIEYVHESNAMIAYLEELFEENGRKIANGNIHGSTRFQRARTYDIMSLLGDAIIYTNVVLMHSDKRSLPWSGLAAEHMSATTAVHAQDKFEKLFSKLESWVEGDIVGKGTPSLSGEGSAVTLADIMLMANVTYALHAFGMDFFDKKRYAALAQWADKAKDATWWCVGSEALRKAEEAGWEAVLEP